MNLKMTLPPFFTTSHKVNGLYQWEGLQNASASLFRWFRDEIASLEYEKTLKEGGNIYDILCEMADSVEVGSKGLIVLPYFAGSATPRYNPHARGIILGLTFAHNKSHIARAFMEGIILEHRDMMESMKKSNINISKVRIIGGLPNHLFGIKSNII